MSNAYQVDRAAVLQKLESGDKTREQLQGRMSKNQLRRILGELTKARIVGCFYRPRKYTLLRLDEK